MRCARPEVRRKRTAAVDGEGFRFARTAGQRETLFFFSEPRVRYVHTQNVFATRARTLWCLCVWTADVELLSGDDIFLPLLFRPLRWETSKCNRFTARVTRVFLLFFLSLLQTKFKGRKRREWIRCLSGTRSDGNGVVGVGFYRIVQSIPQRRSGKTTKKMSVLKT